VPRHNANYFSLAAPCRGLISGEEEHERQIFKFLCAFISHVKPWSQNIRLLLCSVPLLAIHLNKTKALSGGCACGAQSEVGQCDRCHKIMQRFKLNFIEWQRTKGHCWAPAAHVLVHYRFHENQLSGIFPSDHHYCRYHRSSERAGIRPAQIKFA
jgi:hypothetical protein